MAYNRSPYTPYSIYLRGTNQGCIGKHRVSGLEFDCHADSSGFLITVSCNKNLELYPTMTPRKWIRGLCLLSKMICKTWIVLGLVLLLRFYRHMSWMFKGCPCSQHVSLGSNSPPQNNLPTIIKIPKCSQLVNLHFSQCELSA